MGLGLYVLYAVVCNMVLAEEPQCSRYHYEAQTLERVIKTEINLDILRNDIEQIKQAIIKEKTQNDEQNVRMEEKLELIQQEVNNSKKREGEKNTMRQFCTSDAMCSDVEGAECKWLSCKCRPGLSFHHGSNKCVSDCGDHGYGTTFQTEMDAVLFGMNTKTFNSISLEECVNNCLIETGFTCRTVEFKKATQTCNLSWETLHTNPDKHSSKRQDYVLYTRDCRID